MSLADRIVYEDNHLLIINKQAGEIVQGDKTGDEPLVDTLKEYIKRRDHKPGNVFLGLVHRLDRPVAGLLVFAKTSKALSRMNRMFAQGEIQKIYHALVTAKPPVLAQKLSHYIYRNEKQNKSYVAPSARADAKLAELSYSYLVSSDRYHLLEVELHTGRHHQIRCQLSSIGCVIKGDLKYGASRSNADGSISLLSYRLRFIHPVSKVMIDVVAPTPQDKLWEAVHLANSKVSNF